MRAALASDVLAAEEGVPPSGGVAGAAALGLPDLPAWLALESERNAERPAPGLSSRFTAFAREARGEPFARAALLAASRLARTAAEKAEARAGWDAWEARSPGTERAAVAAALGRARAAASPGDAAAGMAALLRAHPGAPESARDLFEPPDLRLLGTAVERADPALRLLRANALAPRQPGAAAELAAPLARVAAFRLDAAALLLGGGRAKTAREALTRPAPLLARDEAERLRIEALLLGADLRLLGEPSPATPGRRPAPRRGAAKAETSVPWAPRPAAPPDAVARFRTLASRAGTLLAQPVPVTEARLLRRETVRAAVRLGLDADALRALPELLAAEPSSTLGAEELFRSAFLPTLSRRPEAYRAAADAFQRQAALYGDVAVRRRATYWAARSLAALGRNAEARGLWASLLSIAVPDLYARWAGQRLGVPVAAAPPLESAAPPAANALRADAPGLPSRELLAIGLASLAEDAAEAERSADPIFLAASAAERFEFRRATAILKGRWPELGTPDEGALPLAVRRAFYPFRQEALIVREAAASGVPPALVYGVIRQESLFQTDARSGVGATGLMQVMPGTGRYLLRMENRRGRPDLKDPEVNVKLGARYLAMMLDEFGGDRIAALAGYNAGPGRPRRWKRLGPGLAADELLEAMPLSETRDYVKRVLFYEAAYAVLHGAAVDPLPLSAGPVSPLP